MKILSVNLIIWHLWDCHMFFNILKKAQNLEFGLIFAKTGSIIELEYKKIITGNQNEEEPDECVIFLNNQLRTGSIDFLFRVVTVYYTVYTIHFILYSVYHTVYSDKCEPKPSIQTGDGIQEQKFKCLLGKNSTAVQREQKKIPLGSIKSDDFNLLSISNEIRTLYPSAICNKSLFIN